MPRRLRETAPPRRRPTRVARSAQGFNKNVTAYVTKGREALAKVPGGDFTLVHHNAYKADELGECFERNAEGAIPASRRGEPRHQLVSIARWRGWFLFRV